MPEGSPGNLPIKKVASDPDVWEVNFTDIKCVGHEAGFSPDGTALHDDEQHPAEQHGGVRHVRPRPPPVEENHFRQGSGLGRRIPESVPSLFLDGRQQDVRLGALPQTAQQRLLCGVDTKTWKIIKKFQNIGPDCQTMSVSYDGKYVFQIFSGFQRLSAGVFVYRQDTLEPVGFLPNFGGHHDCVIVPTLVDHLRNSRCTTL